MEKTVHSCGLKYCTSPKKQDFCASLKHRARTHSILTLIIIRSTHPWIPLFYNSIKARDTEFSTKFSCRDFQEHSVFTGQLRWFWFWRNNRSFKFPRPWFIWKWRYLDVCFCQLQSIPVWFVISWSEFIVIEVLMHEWFLRAWPLAPWGIFLGVVQIVDLNRWLL